MIDTHYATGSLAVIALCYCMLVNMLHLHLSKTSTRRRTIFGKRLTFWSHASMACMTLAPFFMILSYFHPEALFAKLDEVCLCQQWFTFAVMSFVTGLFLFKINYLVRLNMVLAPGRGTQCSPMLAVYGSVLTIEMIVVDVIQYIVIGGKCVPSSGLGCDTDFEKWNGWMAIAILVHDMILYYVFCVCYIHRAKKRLSELHPHDAASARIDDVSEVTASIGSGTVSAASGSGSGNGGVAGGNDGAVFLASRRKEVRKLQMVYKGLVRQFRLTMLAIVACTIDMLINTVWMGYNTLWVFMIDCMVIITFNFMAFRDSHGLVVSLANKLTFVTEQSSAAALELCCSVSDLQIESTIDITATTANAPQGVRNGTDLDREDSFLRFDLDHDVAK